MARRTKIANLQGLGEKLPRGQRGPRGASAGGSSGVRASSPVIVNTDLADGSVTTLANLAVETAKIAPSAAFLARKI